MNFTQQSPQYNHQQQVQKPFTDTFPSFFENPKPQGPYNQQQSEL